MSFSYLTDQLLLHIFQFLEWQDYSNLPLTCKRFSTLMANHEKYWARECLRTYLPMDLDYCSEFYESQEYCKDLKSQIEKIQGKNWKSQFQRMNEVRTQLRNMIKGFVSGPEASTFVNDFYDQFRSPSIPALALKRETVICSTNTIYQDHLSNLLYEDMACKKSSLLFGDNIADMMEKVRTSQQELIDEVRQNKEMDALMEARWYMNGTDSMSEDDIFSDKAQGEDDMSQQMTVEFPKSRLLGLYYLIRAVVRNYCSIIAQYLITMDNPYNLIAEYATRWTVFSYCMLQLNQSCQGFIEVMNEAYEQLFPGYPGFPKFSIWRLMAKTWLSEVYENSGISRALNKSFLTIVGNHREQLLRDAINKKFADSGDQTGAELAYQVSKQLFLTFNTKKNKSMVFDSCIKQIQNNTHPYFSNDIQAESKLLNNFVQTITDLSLNEVNIHYIDCTDIETNYPFCEMESNFLQESQSFYEDQAKIFEDSPSFFCHFLKSDISFSSEILNKRTQTRLGRLQVGHCYDFLRRGISALVNKLDQEALDKVEIAPDLTNYEAYPQLRDFLFEIISEQNAKIEIHVSKTQEMRLIQNLVATIESQGHNNFRSNFRFLCEQQALFEQIKRKDLELKEYNLSKNIPYELGDVDCLFYDLDKHTDTKLIEKLYQEVQKAMLGERDSFESKSTKASGNMSEDLPELEDNLDDLELPQLKAKSRSDFYEVPAGREVLDFDDLDEFDLPDINTLVLSK